VTSGMSHERRDRAEFQREYRLLNNRCHSAALRSLLLTKAPIECRLYRFGVRVRSFDASSNAGGQTQRVR